MNSTTLDAVLHNPRLPSLPAVALELLEMTAQPDLDMKEIAALIETDQALAVKIIRTVNSSYYGLTKPCSSINQAIVYLGLNAVKTLALGFCLVESVDGSENVEFDYVSYWRHGLYSAAAARLIARANRAGEPDTAFLAALVQDIGMVALHRAFRDVYLQVIDLSAGRHCRLPEIEERSIRITHPEVGAVLAERWNLPAELVAVIKHHHDSEHAEPAHRELVRIVDMAQRISQFVAMEDVTQLKQLRKLGRDWFSLTPDDIDSILHQTQDIAHELAQLFKVDVGGRHSVEQLLARAESEQIKSQAAEAAQRSGRPKYIPAIGDDALLEKCGQSPSSQQREAGEEVAAPDARPSTQFVGLFICTCRSIRVAEGASYVQKVKGTDALRESLERALISSVAQDCRVTAVNQDEIGFIMNEESSSKLVEFARQLQQRVQQLTVRMVGVSPTSAVHVTILPQIRVAVCPLPHGVTQPDRDMLQRLLTAARNICPEQAEPVGSVILQKTNPDQIAQAA